MTKERWEHRKEMDLLEKQYFIKSIEHEIKNAELSIERESKNIADWEEEIKSLRLSYENLERVTYEDARADQQGS